MYGVVWKDSSGISPRKLMSAPESMDDIDTPEKAKNEGRQILSELAPGHKSTILPLATVEVSNDMKFALAGCERVFLPMNDDDGELEFVDISATSFWVSQPWWLK